MVSKKLFALVSELDEQNFVEFKVANNNIFFTYQQGTLIHSNTSSLTTFAFLCKEFARGLGWLLLSRYVRKSFSDCLLVRDTEFTEDILGKDGRLCEADTEVRAIIQATINIIEGRVE